MPGMLSEYGKPEVARQLGAIEFGTAGPLVPVAALGWSAAVIRP
jgi:hypothetical protein